MLGLGLRVARQHQLAPVGGLHMRTSTICIALNLTIISRYAERLLVIPMASKLRPIYGANAKENGGPLRPPFHIEESCLLGFAATGGYDPQQTQSQQCQ